jgi:hypothetical protein
MGLNSSDDGGRTDEVPTSEPVGPTSETVVPTSSSPPTTTLTTEKTVKPTPTYTMTRSK